MWCRYITTLIWDDGYTMDVPFNHYRAVYGEDGSITVNVRITPYNVWSGEKSGKTVLIKSIAVHKKFKSWKQVYKHFVSQYGATIDAN